MIAAMPALTTAAAEEVAATASNPPQPAKPPAPAVVDLGAPTELSFESGASALVSGRDAQRQLVVLAKYSGGQTRDFTRLATYHSHPAGIVTIDSTGLLTPLADGKAAVTAQGPAGVQATMEVTVDHFVLDPQVNFPNQIVPIFTKLGCNSGGCHGKASGQNGFKLSLLVCEPGEDFEHLV